jgi:hypothetical protein
VKQVLCAKLVCHPASPVAGVVNIAVEVFTDSAGAARVMFELDAEPGVLATLVMPAPRPPAAADQLWRHTCGELFVALPGDTAYREFNFSPSGAWAGYAFSDYRTPDPMVDALSVSVTRVTMDRHPGGWRLSGLLPPGSLSDEPEMPVMEVATTMVLETTGGALSYWALRHPAAQPDFHHRDGFLSIELNNIEQNHVEQNHANRP